MWPSGSDVHLFTTTGGTRNTHRVPEPLDKREEAGERETRHEGGENSPPGREFSVSARQKSTQGRTVYSARSHSRSHPREGEYGLTPGEGGGGVAAAMEGESPPGDLLSTLSSPPEEFLSPLGVSPIMVHTAEKIARREGRG